MFDVLFIGASTLACGWAEALRKAGKTCAMAESTCLVGADYSESWRSAPVAPDGHTAEGAALLSELRAREAVTDKGILHLPAVAPVLCNRVKNADIPCYFMTRVSGIERCEGGFRVELYGVGVRHTVYTRAIADTTPTFETRAFFGEAAPELASRTLTLCLTRPDTPIGLREGALGEGVYLDYPLLPGEDSVSSLCRFLRERKASPDKYGNAKLIQPAQLLSQRPGETARLFSSDAVWTPSQAYDDPISAYDAGVRFAETAFCSGSPAVPRPLPEYTDEPVELLVAGLGTAGAVAAASGAKRGMKTLGLELGAVPGGTGTAGLVFGYFLGNRESGFYREIDTYGAPLWRSLCVEHCDQGGGLYKLLALGEVFRRLGVKARYGVSVRGVPRPGTPA